MPARRRGAAYPRERLRDRDLGRHDVADDHGAVAGVDQRVHHRRVGRGGEDEQRAHLAKPGDEPAPPVAAEQLLVVDRARAASASRTARPTPGPAARSSTARRRRRSCPPVRADPRRARAPGSAARRRAGRRARRGGARPARARCRAPSPPWRPDPCRRRRSHGTRRAWRRCAAPPRSSPSCVSRSRAALVDPVGLLRLAPDALGLLARRRRARARRGRSSSRRAPR